MKWKKQVSLLHGLQVIVNDFDAYIKAIEAVVMVIAVCFFCLYYLPLYFFEYFFECKVFIFKSDNISCY